MSTNIENNIPQFLFRKHSVKLLSFFVVEISHDRDPVDVQSIIGPNKMNILFPVTRPTVQITCRP